jgi:polyisoprenoid-binding protein YceI
MKKTFSILSIAAAFAMFSFVGKNYHATNYKADLKSSNVAWEGQKVTGKHNGTIALASGVLTDNHGQWTGIFEIDMKTLNNTDLEVGKGKEKLEGHLKSADFFDVEKHPKAKLVVSSITPLEAAKDDATHNVKGFITIKGNTNPVSFDVAMKSEGPKMMCTGTLVIDRTKYDIRYGSKSFFNDIGDKAIMDDFSLKFNIALSAN